MRISGFSFARNAEKHYYPIEASIRSVLPLCDEFVIAVGRGDGNDRTREIVAGIGDPRIRIIDTEWTEAERLRGWIYSQQTNVALDACAGDWCFYLQADEVIHEKDLPAIRRRCEELLDDREVEGLLFRYLHFWGDYEHYQVSHAVYPREVRIVRNGIGVRSVRDAQSFGRNGKKMKVAAVSADVYHYGWVRPPLLMEKKNRMMDTVYHGEDYAERLHGKAGTEPAFDYGPMDRLAIFRGTHPSVMQPWLERMDWKGQLQSTGRPRIRQRHDRFRYRVLTFIEQRLFGGQVRLGAKGYRLVRRKQGKVRDAV